jgi:hypothetical protein
VVDAVADFRSGVRDVFAVEAFVDGLPRFTCIVRSKRSGRGDRDDDAVRVGGVEDDGVEAEAAGSGLPVRTGFVEAQTGEFVPTAAAVGGLEKASIFGAREDGVGVGERRLEVPDALELPWMRRAVVPLVGAGDTVVDELVVDWSPGLAAIVRALQDLAEPAGGLRGVDAVGVNGRALEVVELPAGEVGLGDLPVLAGAVGGEDICGSLGWSGVADLRRGSV